jgi:glycosyltransferase involved in cell wall biosynthesis
VRILHVNKFLYRRGGAEGYMLDLADLQRAQGHDVELFGMRHTADQAPHRFQSLFPAQLDLDPMPGGAVDKARSAARMIWSTSSRRGMAAVVEQFKPDVVHCHNIYHQLSPSVLSPVRAADVPCVMTLHDYKLACPSYQLLDHGHLCDACVTGGPWRAAHHACKDGSRAASTLLAVESTLHRSTRAYGAVDIFVCPSRFLAQVMRRAGVYADRVRVVNHFADVDGTPVKDRPGGNLLFAGRLSHEKGLDVLIRALALTRRATILDVAGDGPARGRLEEQARTTVPGRVRFHGRLDKPALQQLMQSSIACVVPSRWHENQPMAVLESFGSGVPVVASDLGGLPELVRDGVEGWLVPAEDPIALAAALDRVSADPARAQSMGSAARRRVLQDFSSARHLDAVATVYAEAATRHRTVSRSGGPA